MSGVNFAQPDVTLVLDDAGVIRKVTLSNSVSEEGVGAWLGRPWMETAGLGGGEVQQIVDDARESGISAFRQVLQRFPERARTADGVHHHPHGRHRCRPSRYGQEPQGRG